MTKTAKEFIPIKSVSSSKSIMLLVASVRNPILSKVINFYRPNSFLFEVKPGAERKTLMTFFKAEFIVMVLNEGVDNDLEIEIINTLDEQPGSIVYLLYETEEQAFLIRKAIPTEQKHRVHFYRNSNSVSDLMDFVFKIP